MRLLSLTLKGRYKGIYDQHFDFKQTQGNIIALIGLNGSGKSQLLELIGESFAYLERWQRTDFKVNTGIGLGIELIYQKGLGSETSSFELNYISDELSTVNLTYKVYIATSGKVNCHVLNEKGEWQKTPKQQRLPLPMVVGYSSGLNENLQRSFMKNTVQYFNAVNAKANFKKLLERKKNEDANIEEIEKSEKWYRARFKEIYDINSIGEGSDRAYTEYSLKNIDKPNSVYLDYDNASLVLASLSVLKSNELAELLSVLKYKSISKLSISYDLRNEVIEDDDVDNIKRLIRVSSTFNPISELNKLCENVDFDGLDYLSGTIEFDLTDISVQESLSDMNYNSPSQLFDRLYGIQLLGTKSWSTSLRCDLESDDFLDNVKKPLKTNLPLSITELKLVNELDVEVNYDDLSDGEAQLLQILASVKVFSDKETLFLFDEPETHLNPSWRTYFHQHLSDVLAKNYSSAAFGINKQIPQVMLSTHSPFLVSSLKREDVFFFDRNSNGTIKMGPISSQTYGASFDVLIKKHFGLRSLISQTVVEEVKNHLPKDELPESLAESKKWIEKNLGDSMEKAYLLRKLQN